MKNESKPYRPNVGIALINSTGAVLIARRFKNDGPEIILPGLEWQMPQGGINADESPYDAAQRELLEETGVTSCEYLCETDWVTYDFPPYYNQTHRLSAFRGQRQKWFALKFTGHDNEIDLTGQRGETTPEFDSWRWERLERLPELVVPFKRALYMQVTETFLRLLQDNSSLQKTR